jgi:hypothetical protein
MLKIDSFFLQRFGDVIPSPWPFLGYSQLLKKEKKKKKRAGSKTPSGKTIVNCNIDTVL